MEEVFEEVGGYGGVAGGGRADVVDVLGGAEDFDAANPWSGDVPRINFVSDIDLVPAGFGISDEDSRKLGWALWAENAW